MTVFWLLRLELVLSCQNEKSNPPEYRSDKVGGWELGCCCGMKPGMQETKRTAVRWPPGPGQGCEVTKRQGILDAKLGPVPPDVTPYMHHEWTMQLEKAKYNTTPGTRKRSPF